MFHILCLLWVYNKTKITNTSSDGNPLYTEATCTILTCARKTKHYVLYLERTLYLQWL